MNADYRIFSFANGVEEEEEWAEWEYTAGRGGGMGRSFKGLAAVRPHDFGE